MDFYVNGEKLDITLQDEKTVGDVLKAFEVSCQENKLATIGVAIDDKNIPAEEFETILDISLDKVNKIDVSVIAELAIKDNLKQIGQEFNNLIEPLKQIPVEMQSGKDACAKQTIIKLSDTMNLFCSLITWSSLFPETFGQLKVEDKDFSQFLGDFSKILNDFKDALENSDSVLIGDLAEYEICPRLESISNALGEL